MQVLRSGIFVAVVVAGLLGVAAIPGAVQAKDDYTRRIGVFLGGGTGKYVGGLTDHSDIGLLLQGGVRFGWLRHWELEVNGRYGKFEATEIPNGTAFHNQTGALEFNGIYNLNPDGKINPLIWAGAGGLFWQVVDVSNLTSAGMFADGPVAIGYNANGAPALLTDTNFYGNLGIGVEYNFTTRLAVRVALRSDWLWALEQDNTGASASHKPEDYLVPPNTTVGPDEEMAAQLANQRAADVNNFLPAAMLRVTWWFADRDSDGDGIANHKDVCPYEAEDIDGFQDEDGCPDPDNDGDGVPDSADGCPDEAEDVDGFQDEDGCPDLDNDGDTIPDAQDQCPNEAEDPDGFQDDDGCPDGDNDSDGVLDGVDQCPNTPVGIAVDSLGCPLVAKIDQEFILTGVTFRPGKAELEPSSYATLDSVVESMVAHPDISVEVQGHTDSQGDANQNFALSQQRAEAVVTYLVSRGVDASRLTPVGYGEDLPIADNATPEGRARNRRVVLVPMTSSPLDEFDPTRQSEEDELEDLDDDIQIDLDPDRNE